MSTKEDTKKKIEDIMERGRVRGKRKMDKQEPQISASAKKEAKEKFKEEIIEEAKEKAKKIIDNMAEPITKITKVKPQPKKESFYSEPLWKVVIIMWIFIVGILGLMYVMASDISALESTISEQGVEHLDLIKSLSKELTELKEHEHEVPATVAPIIVNVNQKSEIDAEERKEKKEICKEEAKYTDTCAWVTAFGVNKTKTCEQSNWYCNYSRLGNDDVARCIERKCEV